MIEPETYSQVILNQLYRLTDLQTSFGVINLSIVNGRPAVLSRSRRRWSTSWSTAARW
ncbi:MAG: hypothetical protein R3F14_27425 [Polyangiaceae bacterium]